MENERGNLETSYFFPAGSNVIPNSSNANQVLGLNYLGDSSLRDICNRIVKIRVTLNGELSLSETKVCMYCVADLKRRVSSRWDQFKEKLHQHASYLDELSRKSPLDSHNENITVSERDLRCGKMDKLDEDWKNNKDHLEVLHMKTIKLGDNLRELSACEQLLLSLDDDILDGTHKMEMANAEISFLGSRQRKEYNLRERKVPFLSPLFSEIQMIRPTNTSSPSTSADYAPPIAVVVNGRRLCYQPQPSINLNWIEINSAWSCFGTLVVMWRNAYDLSPAVVWEQSDRIHHADPSKEREGFVIQVFPLVGRVALRVSSTSSRSSDTPRSVSSFSTDVMRSRIILEGGIDEVVSSPRDAHQLRTTPHINRAEYHNAIAVIACAVAVTLLDVFILRVRSHAKLGSELDFRVQPLADSTGSQSKDIEVTTKEIASLIERRYAVIVSGWQALCAFPGKMQAVVMTMLTYDRFANLFSGISPKAVGSSSALNCFPVCELLKLSGIEEDELPELVIDMVRSIGVIGGDGCMLVN